MRNQNPKILLYFVSLDQNTPNSKNIQHVQIPENETEPDSDSMEVEVPLPRNFKLLEEYDCAIGKKDHPSLIVGAHDGKIFYGLNEDRDDIYLHYWQGSIIGPQGILIFFQFTILFSFSTLQCLIV